MESSYEVRLIAGLPKLVKHRAILLKDLIEKRNTNEISEGQFSQVIRHLRGKVL